MLRVLWIASCLCACTAADPGMAPDGGSGDACAEAKTHNDLAWIQANVFTPSCAVSGCHHASAAGAGHLTLDEGLSQLQLVNTPSTTATSWMRVVPSDASKSYLLVALGAESGPRPADGVMPIGRPPLCSDEVAAIQRWVAAGAPP